MFIGHHVSGFDLLLFSGGWLLLRQQLLLYLNFEHSHLEYMFNIQSFRFNTGYCPEYRKCNSKIYLPVCQPVT